MITCILLASGFGRRFGCNKLLYPYHGQAMYRYALDALLDLQKQEMGEEEIRILLVTQYREIEEELKNLTVIHNSQAEEGISASIRLGVAASGDADYYLFLSGDQPDLKSDTLRSFLQQSLQVCRSSGKTMASACAQGQPGQPTLFSSMWREELLALHGDQGGRRIMKKHPEQVYWHEIPAEEIRDIDFVPDFSLEELWDA